MKNFLFATVFAVAIITIVSCNNDKAGNTSTSTDPASTESASTNQHAATTVKTGVDAKVAASIKGLLANYLDLKNGLTNDNGSQAAKAGKALVASFGSIDHNSMTPDQMKAFMDIADDAKEMAEHIGKNPDNLEHQREHFDMLSKDMIDLVKIFGAGQTIYVDHCPMYNANKGAVWLSEIKEIKNPYMGSGMATCGMVKEELN